MLLLICIEKLQEEGGIGRQKQADADNGREYRWECFGLESWEPVLLCNRCRLLPQGQVQRPWDETQVDGGDLWKLLWNIRFPYTWDTCFPSTVACLSLCVPACFLTGELNSWIDLLFYYWLPVLLYYITISKKAVFSHADFQILHSDSHFPVELQQILSTVHLGEALCLHWFFHRAAQVHRTE